LPGPDSPLQVKLSWDSTTVTLALHGVVDRGTAVALISHVLDIARASRRECLILDLHHVPRADMAGAAAFGAIQATLDGECMVIIRRPRPEVRRLIEIAQLCADWLEKQEQSAGVSHRVGQD
jgi:anti-anti-sigma regulatory factor